MKDVECFKCQKNGQDAKKCPEIKAKEKKGAFKVRKVDDYCVQEEGEAKSIRYQYSELQCGAKRSIYEILDYFI